MINLKVEKMKCGGCASAVEATIKALDAKAEVKVDLANKTVVVSNSTLGSIELAKAVSKAGYPASV